MANTFDIGETVVCSITVKDSDGTAQDPVTSMNIEISQITPSYSAVITSTAMTDDTGTGNYHYDCQTSGYGAGTYEIKYTATDGTRITIQKDTFILG